MNKGCRLERPGAAPAAQVAACEPSEFLINNGNQLIEGACIAVAPLQEQLSYTVTRLRP